MKDRARLRVREEAAKSLEAQNNARRELGVEGLQYRVRKCLECRKDFISVEARTCNPCRKEKEEIQDFSLDIHVKV
jgi:hypothetical protein